VPGKSEKELLQFGWAELIHPGDKERWLNTYLAAAEKQAQITLIIFFVVSVWKPCFPLFPLFAY